MKRSQYVEGNTVQDLEQRQRILDRVLAGVQSHVRILRKAAYDVEITNRNAYLYGMSQVQSIDARIGNFDAGRIDPLLSILSEDEVVSRLSREIMGLPIIKVDVIPLSEWMGQPGQSSIERAGAWLAHVREVEARMDAYAKRQEEDARQAFAQPAILIQAEVARQRQIRETETIDDAETRKQMPGQKN